ncbi:MAG: DNA repair protein RadC [Agarilytica sp.]
MITPSERLEIESAISLLESKYKREDLRAYCPMQVRKYCQLQLGQLNHEAFGMLKLDAEGSLIEYKQIFRGSVDKAVVHPREVLVEAIDGVASSIIICHNHPSGNVKPSREDMEVTEKLTMLLYNVGIKLVDHIVVSSIDTYSFAQSGILPDPLQLNTKKRFRSRHYTNLAAHEH